MVPVIPGSDCPQSEQIVFRNLEKASCLGSDTRAYHSLLLPTHLGKRIGEADFVIFGPAGLFAIEVKASASCREGRWDFGYRNGRTKNESPAAQARSALFALIAYLERESGIVHLKQRLVYGYGVVFTHCDLSPTAEMPAEILLTRHGLHLFDEWLVGMANHWRTQKHGDQDLNAKDLEKLHALLRTNYEIPLREILRGLEHQAQAFTKSQFVFLDALEMNPRLLCAGGAGTGKTFMAEELALRCSHAGEEVLLVCQSPWLAGFLSSRINYPKVMVSTFDQLPQKAAFSGISKFDRLIVDEGQDLMSIHALEQLAAYLRGGTEEGLWCIFHDANNQKGRWGTYEDTAMKYLHTLSPALVKLNRNCRNTWEILSAIQKHTGCDMGTEGIGRGPEVEWRAFGDGESQAAVLVKILKELWEEELSGDAVLLSPVPAEASCIQALNTKTRRVIRVLDSYTASVSNKNHFRYSQIKDFKGLEADIVVLIDLSEEAFKQTSKSLTETYIGMSRAKSKLFIVHGPS